VQSHDLLCPRGGPRGAAGSKLSFNEYGHDDVIVQAWAAWLRQKPSLDPKKGAVYLDNRSGPTNFHLVQ
jgi:hypothetical protein